LYTGELSIFNTFLKGLINYIDCNSPLMSQQQLASHYDADR